MVILIPDSCRWRLSTLCPERPARFLDSGRSAKPNFCEMEFYEPAVGVLTLPAISRQSLMLEIAKMNVSSTSNSHRSRARFDQ